MVAEIPFQGLSASPADRLNPQGALALAYNLAPEDKAGGLAPVGTPAVVCNLPSDYTLRFIHNGASYSHWIITNDSAIYWCNEGGALALDDQHLIAHASATDISAVGNMLVVAHGASTPVTYHLWRDGAYKPLGDQLPDLPIQFTLSSQGAQGAACAWSIDYYPHEGGGAFYNNEADKRTALTNAVWGCANTAVQRAWSQGLFCHPFFARAAFRMYDGSLVSHTAPVYLDAQSDISARIWGGTYMVDLRINAYKLQLNYLDYDNLRSKLADWTDIIVAIDLFVSAPVYYYDSSKEVSSWRSPEKGTYYAHIPAKDVDLDNLPVALYHVRSFGITPSGIIETDTRNCIKDDILPSLVARRVMTDDHRSHERTAATTLLAFNGRMHMAGITSYPYVGYSPASMFTSGSTTASRIESKVEIHSEFGDSTAGCAFTGSCSIPFDFHVESPGNNAYIEHDTMLFYPDLDAKSITLRIEAGYRKFRINKTLKRHPFLNGAYAWLRKDSLFSYNGYVDSPLEIPDQPTPIPMPNTVAVSAISNPIASEQRPTVSNSTIRAIASAARPLSQGQFGQFPLYVFTDEGIWAMEITSEGKYSARQPITRDVALSPKSIVSIDNAVVFASPRGLMLLSGSETTCISDTLYSNAAPFRLDTLPGLTTVAPAGTPASLENFQRFLSDCRIAYDYQRQRLIVFRDDISYAYIYSLRSHQWGMCGSNLTSVVNSYPQPLAMDSSHRVVDLSVDATYPAQLLVTRPLAIDGTDGFVTVDAAICRGDFTRGDISTVLYGSRDLHHWHLVRSSIDHNLRGFSGSPYRWYRLAIIGRLTAEDTLHAVSISYNPRLRNQLR